MSAARFQEGGVSGASAFAPRHRMAQSLRGPSLAAEIAGFPRVFVDVDAGPVAPAML